MLKFSNNIISYLLIKLKILNIKYFFKYYTFLILFISKYNKKLLYKFFYQKNIGCLKLLKQLSFCIIFFNITKIIRIQCNKI